MRYLLFVLSLFVMSACYGQKLSGKWRGELPQADKSTHFRIEFDLKQTGNQLSGTSTFST